MKNHVININNVEEWRNTLDSIFRWNGNKNLIFLAYMGELYNLHYRVLHGLKFIEENSTVNFDIVPCLGFQSAEQWYEYLNSEEYNIVMITHYIEENIPEDYIEIKEDNLKNYNYNMDKKIITLNLHTKLTSKHQLLYKVDVINMNYAEETDFSSFKVKTKRINDKVIKLI